MKYVVRLTNLLTRGIIAVPILLSCTDQSITPQASLPKKEVHYDFQTGEKIGERTFTYDSQQRLTLSIFDYVDAPITYDEIRYEYDAAGNLIRKMTRPLETEEFFITEYSYEDGLKKSEKTTYKGNPIGEQKFYFYTGQTLDSTQVYGLRYGDTEHQHIYTYLHEHDNAGKLIRSFVENGGGETIFRYSGDLLTETCDLWTGGEACIVNEYNGQGMVVRVSFKTPQGGELKEEWFYKSGILEEKKIYSYLSYELGKNPHVVQLKYEY